MSEINTLIREIHTLVDCLEQYQGGGADCSWLAQLHIELINKRLLDLLVLLQQPASPMTTGNICIH
jgi:hypothetical protein